MTVDGRSPDGDVLRRMRGAGRALVVTVRERADADALAVDAAGVRGVGLLERDRLALICPQVQEAPCIGPNEHFDRAGSGFATATSNSDRRRLRVNSCPDGPKIQLPLCPRKMG